jgi:hypothetical protein
MAQKSTELYTLPKIPSGYGFGYKSNATTEDTHGTTEHRYSKESSIFGDERPIYRGPIKSPRPLIAIPIPM